MIDRSVHFVNMSTSRSSLPWERIEHARHEAKVAEAWLYRVIAEEIADRRISEVKAAEHLGISRTTLRKRLAKVRFTQPKIV